MGNARIDNVDNDANDLTKLDLYQKYRPLVWDDMIGQHATIQGLRQSVIKDNIPSAYLFSGLHGSGKTTAAMILARALNCPNVDDKGNPCNECDVCRSIRLDATMTGFNYQAASNSTNIDAVRDIIKQAYVRSPLKHPIWIIDEFQALQKSNGAYDEFLSPLETGIPTTFIFCTTEINKINKPALISRCRKFSFTPITPREMIPYCVSIMRNEGYEILKDGEQPNTDKYVTRSQIISSVESGGGSARDTLSRLSAILMSGEGSDGMSPTESLLIDVFERKSIKDTLLDIMKASENGVDMITLGNSLSDSFARLAMLADKAPVSDADSPIIRRTASKEDAMTFVHALDIMGTALSDMNWGSAEPRTVISTAMMRILAMTRKNEE